MTSFASRTASFVRSPFANRALHVLWAFCSGGGCLTVLFLMWAHCTVWLGTTSAATTAFTLSLAAGVTCGALPGLNRLSRKIGNGRFLTLCHLLLALHVLCAVPLLSLLNGRVAFGLHRPDAEAWNIAVNLLLSAPLLFWPALLCAAIGGRVLQGVCLRRAGSENSDPQAWALIPAPLWLMGGQIGLILLLAQASRGGLRVAGGWSCALHVLAGAIAYWRVGGASVIALSSGVARRGLHTLGKFAAVVLIGGMIAATQRVLEQLSPVSIYTLAGESGSMIFGMVAAAGCLRRDAKLHSALFDRWLVVMWCAALGGAIPALFPVGMWASLEINSAVSQVGQSLLCRSLLLVVGLAPLWCAWGMATAAPKERLATGKCPHALHLSPLGVTSLACGYLWAARLLESVSASVLILGFATCLVVGTATILLWRRMFSQSWGGKLSFATAAVIAVAGLAGAQNFNAPLAAKILYSTHSFAAYQSGMPIAQLAVLDQGRFVKECPSERGILTLWSYGGLQFQVRENGIPKGVLSTDPHIFPQFSPELLQTVVPLLLHEAPRQVLVLGLNSSLPVQGVLQFPVQQVTCLEGERGLVRLVQGDLAHWCSTNPFDDERLTVKVLEPAWGLAAPALYDVIVSANDQGALLKSQVSLTREFYARASQALKPNGIFCQRFQFIDVGPEPIRQAAKTLQVVFDSVTAIEVAPGELLFLATNDNRGILREKLLERLQLDHVRSALAQVGLDWSVMVNLPAIKPEELAAFAAASPARLNSAGTAQLAFLAPREVFRWSNKLGEVETATAPHTGRLLDWMDPAEASSKELVRRLAEVTAQQNLQTKYSDQFWAYRASLRDQVQNHPRTLIEQVRASYEDQEPHPEDQRRVRYFEALAQAIKTHEPSAIQKLLAFQTPYDPLVTYFVHQEAAEILAHSEPGSPADEFRLRLFAVYFTSPQDRAVRNVLRALDLLTQHPEIEAQPAARWDHYNSLLQMLQLRWEQRVGTTPGESAQVVLGEIDSCLLASETALGTMDDLARAAGLPESLHKSRRKVLEIHLIRPLREYRGVIFNHHQAALQKRHAGNQLLNAISGTEENQAADAGRLPTATPAAELPLLPTP